MIEIGRHFDATHFNMILNHPAVRPDVVELPDGPVDATRVLADHNNVALLGEYGGVVFIKLSVGVYEAHTQAVPEGRGAWILEVLRAACSWMYTNTDAFEIVTRIPEHHPGAKRLAAAAGGRFEFERPGECLWRGTKQTALVYSFRIYDWATNTDTFDQVGHDFHAFLHEEAKRIGVTGRPHDDDPNHNRYIGIALAMVDAGLPIKAVNFYNRWALISRHPPVKLVKQDPVTVQMDIGNLIFENGTKRIEPMDIAA